MYPKTKCKQKGSWNYERYDTTSGNLSLTYGLLPLLVVSTGDYTEMYSTNGIPKLRT